MKHMYVFSLSQISYMPIDKQQKILRKNKFKKFKAFSNENAYAFSCIKDGILYVVFMGTNFDNIEDIKDNLDVAKVKFGRGKVHAGYKRHLDKIWKQLVNHISVSMYEKIIVTGHSMGAAVGQIMNARIAGTMGYYFGSPHVVDKKTCKYNKSFVYNIQNEYDLVTNLPPKLFFGFRSLGTKFILKYGKLSIRNRTLTEYFYTVFYMIAFLLLLLFSKIFGVKDGLKNILVKNHELIDYHRNLEACLVEEMFTMFRNKNKIKKL